MENHRINSTLLMYESTLKRLNAVILITMTFARKKQKILAIF